MSTPKVDKDKDADEIEEEIEENISIDESSSLVEANEELKKLENIANRKRQLFDFEDENVNQVAGTSRFKNFDDSQLEDALSGSGLAQHFKPHEIDEEGDGGNDDDATDISSPNEEFKNESSAGVENITQNSSNEIDSLDEVLNELDSLPIEADGSGDVERKTNDVVVPIPKEEQRDQSPDDVILLNDKRVSINSLKTLQHTSHETSLNNQSTTQDVSDIVRDDTTIVSHKRDLMMRKSKSQDVMRLPSTSLAVDRTFRSLDVPYEHHEDDEKLVADMKHDDDENRTNITDFLINAEELGELDPNIDIYNENEMNRILGGDDDLVPTDAKEQIVDVGEGQQSLTENSGDDDILNLKEKINSLSNSRHSSADKKDEIVVAPVEPAIEGDSDRPSTIVKPMEKLEHSKEALDDITEESEPPLESLTIEPTPVKQVLDVTSFVNLEKESSTDTTTTTTATTTGTPTQSSLAENGQEIRMILQQHMSDYNDIPPSDIPAEIPPLAGAGSGGGGNGNGSSEFDSVVSLNMFHMMENKVKELNEIIAGKDVFWWIFPRIKLNQIH